MNVLVFPVTEGKVNTFQLVQAVLEDSQTKFKFVPKKGECIPTIRTSTGESLQGEQTCLRFIARVLGAYGTNLLDSAFVDQYLETSLSLSEKSTLPTHCSALDTRLAMRTFLVGYALTIADLSVWTQLHYNPRFNALKKEMVHLSRWYAFIYSHPSVSSLLQQPKPQEQTSTENTAETTAATPSNMLALPGAEMGKVVTRFPPEPSGYLHIGHAKAAILNDYYAKLYKGRLLLRFDDTNPDKENDDFVQSIVEDLKLLGIEFSGPTSHTSDYFDQIQTYCETLIRQGDAYADDTDVETIRDERLNCVESKNRNNSVEKNLEMWSNMKLGTESGLKCVIRAKLDMQSKNGCLRDPTLYRCNLTPHHRLGTRYKVYPTYDFCCPIVDSLEGVTHALRTTEYHDRDPQYYWIIEKLGIRKPLIGDYSRLNFVHTLLSKRKLKWFVDEGKVSGWDDPRFPTVRGIYRRGLEIEALREFVYSVGASKATNLMQWDKLWNFNKKIIDKSAHRFTAVTAQNIVKVSVNDSEQDNLTSVQIVALHPKDKSLGEKEVLRSNVIFMEQLDAQACSVGEEVTFMSWGNAIVRGIEKDGQGIVTSMSVDLNLSGSVKSTKKKLTWIAESALHASVKATLVELGYLITVPSIEAGMNFDDVLAADEDTWKSTEVLGESAMKSIQKGQIIQINRRGFYKCDTTSPMVFFAIPDGRTKSVSKIA